MAFKMKGPNFGKGTGSENPMKINSSFKKSSRFGRFVKGVKEVGSAIKETFTTGSTPAENRSRARAKRSEQALIEQKIRHGKFDESKLNSFQKTVYKEMKARDKAKQEKANIEKNVAENKAAGPKTQTQTKKKDDKRPPMAKKGDIEKGSHLSTKKKKRPQTMAEAVAEAKAKNADPKTREKDEANLSKHLQANLRSESPNKMIKKKDATKDHNKAARKTEGTRLRQSIRRAANKVKAKSVMKMKKKDSAMKMKKDDAMKMKKDPMKMKTKDPMKLNKGFDKLPKEVQAKIMKKKK